jgi:hypothetical protein
VVCSEDNGAIQCVRVEVESLLFVMKEPHENLVKSVEERGKGWLGGMPRYAFMRI